MMKFYIARFSAFVSLATGITYGFFGDFVQGGYFLILSLILDRMGDRELARAVSKTLKGK